MQNFQFSIFQFPVRIWSLRYGKHFQPYTSKRGFTLVELLIAITIIVLLFTIGTAAYRSYSRRQVLVETVSTLKADLQLAEQKAASGVRPTGCTNSVVLRGYIVRFTSTGYTVYADCVDPAGWNSTDPEVGQYNFPATVAKTAGSSEITFKVLGQGTTSSTDDTVTLNQEVTNQTAVITITKGGSIY